MRASLPSKISKIVAKISNVNGSKCQRIQIQTNKKSASVRRSFSSLAPHFDEGESDAVNCDSTTTSTLTSTQTQLGDISSNPNIGGSPSVNIHVSNVKATTSSNVKVAKSKSNGRKTMSRLEEMRKKLNLLDEEGSGSGRGFEKFTSGEMMSDEKNIKKREKRKEPSPLKTSLISWRQILDTAKSHFTESDSDTLMSASAGNGVHGHEHIHDNMLTDSFSRKHTYLRISLGERCNLRCLYCMPPEGVPLQAQDKLINADEVERLVKLFALGGVDKVRLTGGEPLLRKDLPQIISSIAAQPTINSVGITTNGITLSRHLPSLVEAGMTHANISLDTLDESKFEEITRRRGLNKVLKAIEDACAILPRGQVKINCVVMKGFNDNELRDFVELSKHLPVDVRFIEWMPFNDNGWNNDRFLSYASMMKRIVSDEFDDSIDIDGRETNLSSMKGLGPFELGRLLDGENDTTKWWQAEGHLGRLGFITSMTEHFCGTCNRVRITADGQLKACLFGSAEVSLRDAMREGASDTDLGLIIRAALQKKKFALGGHGNAEGIKKANNNRPMTLIGG